jgi:transitional endoplasmic reticulum ATPase
MLMDDNPTYQAATMPLIAQDEELPFQRKMLLEHAAENAQFFILHFNIYDYVFTHSLSEYSGYESIRLREYLGNLLLAQKFDIIIFYSQVTGFVFQNETMRTTVEDYVPEDVRSKVRFYGQPPKGPPPHPQGEVITAFTYLDHILSYRPPQNGDKPGEVQPQLRIGIILENLDSLAPHGGHQSAAPHVSFVIGMLQKWSRDSKLRPHIIIGLTSDLGQVASSLYASGSEGRAYKVELPGEDTRTSSDQGRERSNWIKYILRFITPDEQSNPFDLEGENSIRTAEDLAAITSGFSYDNLSDLIFRAAQSGCPLTFDFVQERKQEIITTESRDLLEIIPPDHEFEDIAGYEYIIDYLIEIREVIKHQAENPVMTRIVPKGILFLGPPGTGKSYMAAALAKEMKFNMVKLKNVRSMWVGESERNLNRVLELLDSMAPVIVFVDEIDAALGQRGSGGGAGGGSQVEQRIFQRILEFIAADKYRGRVLWIAASNRPDQIDAALISRFDMVIPVLLPNRDARREMLVDVFPKKIGYKFTGFTGTGKRSKKITQCLKMTETFSGRELDTVCRRAMQFAGRELIMGEESPAAAEITVKPDHLIEAIQEFRVARDLEQYALQTLLAIQATNFKSFLPPLAEIVHLNITSEVDGELCLDEDKLHNRINELKTATTRRNWGMGV